MLRRTLRRGFLVFVPCKALWCRGTFDELLGGGLCLCRFGFFVIPNGGFWVP